MRILHLSSAGRKAGAGKGALNTHLALRRLGVDSKLMFLKEVEDPEAFIFSFTSNRLKAAVRKAITFVDRSPLMFYRERKNQIFSPGFVGHRIRNHSLVQEADIIHLHWVNHGFIDISELSSLGKPIVWTMRDMWPFTGGCHHSFHCRNFENNCGKCHVLGSRNEIDLSRFILNHKKNQMPVSRIRWVAISRWLKEQALQSALLRNQPIEIIYSGVDSEIFVKHDKRECRREFGLPVDARVILLGAQDLKAPYKGLQYAVDALNQMGNDQRLFVLTFGEKVGPCFDRRLRLKEVGFIEDERTLSRLYSAADVFLAPSTAEAFGKTLAEAQLCGVPVVCFNHGGPAEIVSHKETGFVADYQSVSSFKAGINYVLDGDLDPRAIINRAQTLFSIERIAQQYRTLYAARLEVPNRWGYEGLHAELPD